VRLAPVLARLVLVAALLVSRARADQSALPLAPRDGALIVVEGARAHRAPAKLRIAPGGLALDF
jgi:hypothetical protein